MPTLNKVELMNGPHSGQLAYQEVENGAERLLNVEGEAFDTGGVTWACKVVEADIEAPWETDPKAKAAKEAKAKAAADAEVKAKAKAADDEAKAKAESAPKTKTAAAKRDVRKSPRKPRHK